MCVFDQQALREHYGLAQALLRALLGRQLQPDSLELMTPAAAMLAPPLSVLPAEAEFGGWRAQLRARSRQKEQKIREEWATERRSLQRQSDTFKEYASAARF